jgi:hypothetical protein
VKKTEVSEHPVTACSGGNNRAAVDVGRRAVLRKRPIERIGRRGVGTVDPGRLTGKGLQIEDRIAVADGALRSWSTGTRPI